MGKAFGVVQCAVLVKIFLLFPVVLKFLIRLSLWYPKTRRGQGCLEHVEQSQKRCSLEERADRILKERADKGKLCFALIC